MATTVCRLRPLFGRLVNAYEKRILYLNIKSRTYITSSVSCYKSWQDELKSKNETLVLNRGTAVLRWFSSDKKLTTEEISEKVLTVCKTFDKIPADKLTLESHFMNDLGLDSLDHVELIMNIEDDFNFEIPDADAEKLLRPRDIVAYIEQKEQASSKE